MTTLHHAISEQGSLGKVYQGLRKARQSHGWFGLAGAWRGYVARRRLAQWRARGGRQVVILCPESVLYVAQLFVRALEVVGWQCVVITARPSGGFADELHVVICPPAFKSLPRLYFAYQMEQTVSSRWFKRRYFAALNRAVAIFDYSLVNIEALSAKIRYEQIYYLPLGYTPNHTEQAADGVDYDVVFYGDFRNPRRQMYLQALEQAFRVKVLCWVYGDELYRELARGKVVVNIHYYEDALLETPRIYECLSRGLLVVSEDSSDMAHHEALRDAVDFVPAGDVATMLARVRHWCDHDDEREAHIARYRQDWAQRPNEFNFYLYRCLLAHDLLSFDDFYAATRAHQPPHGDFWCLGLPETVGRQKAFAAENTYGITSIVGLRHYLSWVGCGLSYKYMARLAVDLNLPMVTICEDDVGFLPGFAERYAQIQAGLAQLAAPWSVCSLLIAHVTEDTELRAELPLAELGIYDVNRLLSMVCNIYSLPFMQVMSQWDEQYRHRLNNQIDRYLHRVARENMFEVAYKVALPFPVWHKDEVGSTLWGTVSYAPMIAQSEAKLISMAAG